MVLAGKVKAGIPSFPVVTPTEMPCGKLVPVGPESTSNVASVLLCPVDKEWVGAVDPGRPIELGSDAGNEELCVDCLLAPAVTCSVVWAKITAFHGTPGPQMRTLTATAIRGPSRGDRGCAGPSQPISCLPTLPVLLTPEQVPATEPCPAGPQLRGGL